MHLLFNYYTASTVLGKLFLEFIWQCFVRGSISFHAPPGKACPHIPTQKAKRVYFNHGYKIFIVCITNCFTSIKYSRQPGRRCTAPGLAHLNGTLPSVMIGFAKFSAESKIYWPSGPYFLSTTLKPFLNYLWPSVLFFTPPYEIFPLCWGCFWMLPPDSPLVVSGFRKHHSQAASFYLTFRRIKMENNL